jgi:excisionase family DNA binding protein
MNSQILTLDELSEYIKISRFTIYDWVYRKKIPYIKLGKNLRFRRELIDDWIDAKQNIPIELRGEKLYNGVPTVGSDERSFS